MLLERLPSFDALSAWPAREEQARLSAELHAVSDTLAFVTKTAIERGHRVRALTCEIEAAKAMLPEHSALIRPQPAEFFDQADAVRTDELLQRLN